MTAGMCVLLVVFFSTVVLPSVSAGGVYCAKTARARAAALGLPYPGVDGAPDLYGPAHHAMHPGTMLFRPRPYTNDDRVLAEIEPNMASYRRSQPGVSSLDGTIHQHASPRGPKSTFRLGYGTYNPVQHKYTSDKALTFPRGQSVTNRRSNFKEVKHVAHPTLFETPGQPDLVSWVPQGRNRPLSFVYNEHGLVDESVPNRHGMSLSGLPLPQSWGHGTYQRGLTGYGLGKEVPVLGSSRFTNGDSVRAMTRPGPAADGLKRTRFPVRLAQPLQRSLNVKQFVQGNPVFRHLQQPKAGTVRISGGSKGSDSWFVK